MATPSKKPASRAAAEEPAPALAETVEPMAEMQDSVRVVLEKGVAETRAVYEKAKAAADEAANAFESSFAAAKDGVLAINVKALEALRANVDANFDFVKAAFSARSLSDLVALQSEFTRKQVEAVTGQSKEIGAMAQKLMSQAADPLKNQVAKTFKMAG